MVVRSAGLMRPVGIPQVRLREKREARIEEREQVQPGAAPRIRTLAGRPANRAAARELR